MRLTRTFHASAGRLNDAAVAATEDEETKPEDLDVFPGEFLFNPYIGVPVGALSIMSLHELGVYHFDAETQLLGLFVMFVGTIYSQGGAAIAANFDETAEQVMREQRAVEDAAVDALRVARDAYAAETAIQEDIQTIFEAQSALMDEIVEAKNNQLAHDVRDHVVSRLDNVVRAESALTASLQTDLVNAATAEVTKKAASEASKKAALESAFAAIANPDAPSQDAIGAMYADFFKSFDAKLAEAKGKEIDATPDMQKAMEEAMGAAKVRDDLDFVNVAAPSKISLASL